MKGHALMLVGASLAMFGCSAIPLSSGGNKVLVDLEPAGDQCTFLGQVTGNQGNFFTGPYTSNANLETGAMNDLRNKAAEMGANYVRVLKDQSSYTGSVGLFEGSGGGRSEQTGVVIVGNSYQCPGL